MSEKQKQNTIILAVAMIICVILTSLLLTNFVECTNCQIKISGKYYLSRGGDIYCKKCRVTHYECSQCRKEITDKYYFSISNKPLCSKCGNEYYEGYPGNLEKKAKNIFGRVDNTKRNVIVIVELIGFIGAMVVINKKKVAETIKSEGIASVTKKIPVIKEEVKKVVEPIVKKEVPTEPKADIKPEVKVEKAPEVRKEVTIEKTSASTEVRGGLRTTFKSKTEESLSTSSTSSSSDEKTGDWFKSAGDL